MGYIYCITNKINGKKYVGKTESTIEKRFTEHCKDYKRKRCEKRPLYSAFKKYGIDNFEITELEKVFDSAELCNREIYWIKELNTYSNGYNATLGGDSKSYIDDSEINNMVSLYKSGKSIREISKIVKHDSGHISKLLKSRGLTILPSKIYISKRVAQINIETGEILNKFESLNEAVKFLINSGISSCRLDNASSCIQHISDCCKGKSEISYGFKWKFI